MPLRNLSPPQKDAVRHVSSPSIVTAGAGSGKTRTLTGKIAYLVNELQLAPDRILAITFTNKAAQEMKNRLRAATGRPASDFPWVRTFHSACFRILKEHCELLGYRTPLLIHDESQSRTHLKKVLAELNLDKKHLYGAAAMISHGKNSGNPDAWVRVHGKMPRKIEVYRRYNEMLEQNNSVDFDDILLLTRDLLTKFPEVRDLYRDRFDYILVDEFQDSNDIQNQILDLLLRDGNLTVVGDDYQSIYKFRGADPSHFINFPAKYQGARVFRLEENFRSTQQIVAASDALIANNQSRMEKQCYSTREGSPIQMMVFPNDDIEARWVADRCIQYVNRHAIPFEKIAILYRTKFTSLPFERALRAARIPYTMVGAQGFFQRREIQDIHSYLICAVNPHDDLSFERIINVPRRGIGPGAMQKILSGREHGTTLQDACWKAIRNGYLPKKAALELEKLLLLIRSLASERPDAAMRRMLDETNYKEHLRGISENEDDYAGRLENIKQMIYDASQKENTPDYLEDAALIRDDQDQSEKKTGVKLSTIHAAKGLEFKVVFIVAAEEGILPHQRSCILENGKENVGGIEEERRLMYVAMTRASDYLHISCAEYRRGEGMIPSRFLDELPQSCLS